MTHPVLGGGGAEVDMVSNRPMAESLEEQGKKALNKFKRTVHQAQTLAQELQSGNPVVRVLAERFRKRIRELIKADKECRALQGISSALRFTLELGPILAEEEVRQILGPQLSQFMEAEEAAPERDTGPK